MAARPLLCPCPDKRASLQAVSALIFVRKWAINTKYKASFRDIFNFNIFLYLKGSEGSGGPRGEAGKAGERVNYTLR